MRTHVLSVSEVRAQQRLLQCKLTAFQFSPVQQAVGVERVVDTAAPIHVEGEAQRRAALADHLAIRIDLFCRTAVFSHQVLGGILAFGRHLRIQFERLEVDLRRHFAFKVGQCLLQRRQSHCAPGTGDVGDEIDTEGGGSRWHGHGYLRKS
jgi:hypothetical protein